MYLETLTQIPGVSGDEGLVREFIIEKIKDVVDEITVDSIGNLVCSIKGTGESNKKVMVAAHMDEVGFMVSGITPKGMIKLLPIDLSTVPFGEEKDKLQIKKIKVELIKRNDI